MTELSTQIITRAGKEKVITVAIEDELAAWLVTQPKIVYHDFLLSEYEAKCVERKETRRTQSLDHSLDNGFDIADESADVVKEVLQKCDNEQLYAAMKTLTDKQYQVLWLYAVDGLTYEEIAAKMGIRWDTVRDHYHTAVKKVQKIF